MADNDGWWRHGDPSRGWWEEWKVEEMRKPTSSYKPISELPTTNTYGDFSNSASSMRSTCEGASIGSNDGDGEGFIIGLAIFVFIACLGYFWSSSQKKSDSSGGKQDSSRALAGTTASNIMPIIKHNVVFRLSLLVDNTAISLHGKLYKVVSADNSNAVFSEGIINQDNTIDFQAPEKAKLRVLIPALLNIIDISTLVAKDWVGTSFLNEWHGATQEPIVVSLEDHAGRLEIVRIMTAKSKNNAEQDDNEVTEDLLIATPTYDESAKPRPRYILPKNTVLSFDLNNDDVEEYLTLVDRRLNCGSHACDARIYQLFDGKYHEIAKVAVPNEPSVSNVSVMESANKGYHDIKAVYWHAYGIKNVIYIWNGKTYVEKLESQLPDGTTKTKVIAEQVR